MQRPVDYDSGSGNAFSAWLDMFRWLAATEVLLFHARHRVFENVRIDFGSSSSIAYTVMGVLSSFGQPAVIIFFVLSGFLVGGRSLENFERIGRFDALLYFSDRLTRLWTVLIPVFIVTIFLNLISSIQSQPGTDFHELTRVINETSSIYSFICNTAFLQTALCQQFGGNGALWSLFNEFWYYVAWPPTMIALLSADTTKRIIAAGAVIFLLGFLTKLQFVGPNLILYYLLWLLGVAASKLKRPFLGANLWVAIVSLGVAVLVWRIASQRAVQGTDTLREFSFDLLVALAMANLILCLKALPRTPMPPLSSWHAPLAGFSFTLYCLHTPLIHMLCSFSWPLTGPLWHAEPSGFAPLVIYCVIVAICMVSAFALAYVTERHTQMIRTAVRRWLKPPSLA